MKISIKHTKVTYTIKGPDGDKKFTYCFIEKFVNGVRLIGSWEKGKLSPAF